MPHIEVQYGKLRRMLEPFIVTNPQVDNTLLRLKPGARVCDVGAGGRRIVPDVVAVDAFWGKDTDIVSDAAALSMRDEVMDCVFCTGTFEHLPDPWAAAREIVRITKPGGVVHIEAPFMQGYHADPHDYWRFTKDGLRQLFPGFEELDCGVHIGPASGFSWTFVAFCQGLARTEFARKMLFRLGRLLVFPWKYLDFFATRGPYSHLAASAVYYVGRKPRKAM